MPFTKNQLRRGNYANLQNRLFLKPYVHYLAAQLTEDQHLIALPCRSPVPVTMHKRSYYAFSNRSGTLRERWATLGVPFSVNNATKNMFPKSVVHGYTGTRVHGYTGYTGTRGTRVHRVHGYTGYGMLKMMKRKTESDLKSASRVPRVCTPVYPVYPCTPCTRVL